MSAQPQSLAEILADPDVVAIEAELDAQISRHQKLRASEAEFSAAVLKAAATGGPVLVIPVTPYLH